ncbi:MAG: hypothetical protein ACR2RV_08515, partial [Verrucomicrobiales bacterium]
LSPSKQIETAIEQGVPVFNDGNHAKCAAIYKGCLAELAKEDSIDSKLRSAVKVLLKKGEKTSDDIDRAWLYRVGLDELYSAISDS